MEKVQQVSLEDAYKLAQQYHEQGNLTLAERTYQDILSVYPEDFHSLHFIGIIAFQQGNIMDAYDYLDRAINIDDTNADTWNAYGVMQGELGNAENSIESFKKSLAIRPDFSECLSNLSHAYWKKGDNEKAIEASQKALDIEPDMVNALINLGAALSHEKKIEEAIEKWQRVLEIQPNQPNAYINIGNGLRDLGKISESAEYCKKAIELAPGHPQALLNYANVLRDQGNFVESEATYRKAIANDPKFLEAHNNLAIVLMDQQNYEDAATSARFAIAFDENNVLAYTNLAAALREQGRLKDAEEAGRKALRLDPESSEAKIDLADILYLSDRYAEAETLIKEAMEEIPDNPRLHIKLSGFLEKSNKFDEALEAANKAIELGPEMPETHHRLAMVYYMDNRIEEALKALNKALELKPEFAIALGTKSDLLQSHGDMKGAKDTIEEALSISPNLVFLYYTLSKVTKFTEDNQHFKAMKTLAEKESTLGIGQNTSLNFALFKAYEDLGHHDDAFKALKKGNDLKRSSVVFDIHAQKSLFDRIKTTYTKQNLEAFEGKGCKDDAPIFIVGMPRSGTTLTEQIISSHHDVFGAGELYYLANLDKELDPLKPDNAKEWGEKYLEHVRNIHPDAAKAKKVTDKMPGNFMQIGQIIATLPNAKIIHCRRNPVDTSLSCYKQLFSRGHYWSYNLDEMAIHYGFYSDMMNHWREIAPDKFIEIYYEDTVNDFENQARMLIDYVGLEWDDACLTPHKTKRSILTASKGQVRKPIYKTSVEAWRKYEEQLSDFAEKLEPYMREKSS